MLDCMVDLLVLDTEERIKAFTHPYRLKLLYVLRETKRPMTATEVARAIGDGPGKVHYHMRALEAAGIVVVARTETINGIVARYYEPAARHYSVADAARGAIGGEPRDEVARMISRRFRDGLRAFLDRTTGAADEADGPRAGEGAFLFEHVVHCDDDQWIAFREAVEALVASRAEPLPGARPRRVFIAGATDRPADAPGRPGSTGRTGPEPPGAAWPPRPEPER